MVAAGIETDELSLGIDGSGDIALSRVVETEAVEVDERMYVTDALRFDIDGSGDVLVRGEPQVSSRVSGSGTVRRMSEAP